MRLILRWSLALIFAIWWGGFTFYAGIVVPIGNQVLGSKVRQGMITQQVSNKLNYGGVITLALAGAVLISETKTKRRAVWATGVVSWAAMTICLVILFVMHGRLDALLDTSRRIVLDDGKFHPLHELYLTVSAIQWFAGIVFWGYLLSGMGAKTEAAVGGQVAS